MDHTGDTRHHFDPADARAIAEAKARFMELNGAGFTAAKRLGEGKSQVLKSFAPWTEAKAQAQDGPPGNLGDPAHVHVRASRQLGRHSFLHILKPRECAHYYKHAR
jgi:hypothetical protein